MLHIVGQNGFEAWMARNGVKEGRLQRVYQSVYLDADDDPREVLPRYAVEIGVTLFRGARLSHESAARIDVAADGVLYLTGSYHGERSLGDGALRIKVRKQASSQRTVDCQYFSLISNRWKHARASHPIHNLLEIFSQEDWRSRISEAEMIACIRGILRNPEYGPYFGDMAKTFAKRTRAARALDALLAFMKDHTLDRNELEALAEDSAMNGRSTFFVYHHDQCVGALSLVLDGWSFEPYTAVPQVIAPYSGSGLPLWLHELTAEKASLRRALGHTEVDQITADPVADPEATTAGVRRFMSNVTVVPHGRNRVLLVNDQILQPLGDASADGQFLGRALDRLGNFARVADAAGQEMAHLIRQKNMPTPSGMQSKVPVCLMSGMIDTATHDMPFTHFLKFPPASAGWAKALEISEYLGAMMARAAGLEAAETALIDLRSAGVLPEKMLDPLGTAARRREGAEPVWGVLVERFDIRQTPEDRGHYFNADMTTMLGLRADQKFDGSWEEVARVVAECSTSGKADLEALFRRAVVSWMYGDGDCHLKNLAILHRGDAMHGVADTAVERRLAPAFDITCGLAGEYSTDMALPMGGKQRDLQMRDFLRFGVAHCGLSKDEAEVIIEDAVSRMLAAQAMLEDGIQRGRVQGLLSEEACADPLVGDVVREIGRLMTARAEDLGIRYEPPILEIGSSPDDLDQGDRLMPRVPGPLPPSDVDRETEEETDGDLVATSGP
jgi:serine/threonine-protein kinase HipA